MISWATVEDVLDTLNEKNPSLFSQALLIGGWAALLYYRQLELKKNPLFPVPRPDSQERLLSKDIDFTHVWKQDFFESYPNLIVRPAQGSPYMEIEGMRIGFAQVGVTFDPEEAFEKARLFKTTAGTHFAVLDPVRLYREKQALVQKHRGKSNDIFHLQIAETYCRFELAEAIQKHQADPIVANQVKLDHLARELKYLAPELF